jgi:hypothetical protein
MKGFPFLVATASCLVNVGSFGLSSGHVGRQPFGGISASSRPITSPPPMQQRPRCSPRDHLSALRSSRSSSSSRANEGKESTPAVVVPGSGGGTVSELTGSKAFEAAVENIQEGELVVVKFWAPWCRACKVSHDDPKWQTDLSLLPRAAAYVFFRA